MKAPSKQVVDAAIAEFIDQMNNIALAAGVCAICGCEMAAAELSPQHLNSIPNPHRLTLNAPHPNHDIYNGMLLHPPGLTNNGIVVE